MSHNPVSVDRPNSNGAPDSITSLIALFEKLWFAGERPAIEFFLAEAGPRRQALLVELVHVELELRLKAGEQARVEEYVQRFPEVGANGRVPADLIEAEFRLRARREPELTLEDYRLRFPEWEPPLMLVETLAAGNAMPMLTPEQEGAGVPVERPVIPGLEVLDELGRGGMAMVYMVRQTALKRLAALKILRPGARAEEQTRFRTEAEAAARLTHPGIARIYEVGERQGQPYLVLEYVEGGSLAQRLEGTPWPLREAAELVLKLAEAVQYAHEQGVLHRDLSPGNVLLDGEGQPKVCDFGLAKILVSAEVGPTRTDSVLGTPSYMSPEQAAGQARQVGPRADVYGLGAILYHLLTARPPFKGETSLETLRQVMTDEPVSPHRLRSTVPADLETICLKCLQKQPAERYTSAATLAADLRCFLAGEPIKGKPPSGWRLAWRWAGKHPTTTAVLAAGLLLAIVIVAGSIWHTVQLGEALEETSKERLQAIQNAQWAKQTQYASDMRLGYQSFKLGDAFRLDSLLAGHLPSPEDPAPPAFEWRYLSRFRQNTPNRWRAYQYLNWIGYSPDGQLFATAGTDPGNSNIKVWDTATNERVSEIRLINGFARSERPVAFSPGTPCWLAVCDGHNVQRWNPRTGERIGKLLRHVNPIGLVTVSSNGRQIITTGEGPITIWDVATETPVGSLPETSKQVTSMALAHDDITLITYQKDAYLPYKLWDLSTGKNITMSYMGAPLFSSPRGTFLGGIANGGRQILLANSHGRRQEDWLPSEIFRASAVAISTDDRLVMIGCDDGSVRIYDLLTRKSHAYLRWQTYPIFQVQFAPDGKMIAAATEEGMVYHLQTPKSHEPDTLQPKLNPIGPMAFAPDGQLLAVADQDWTIKLVDTKTGKVKTVLSGHLNHADAVAFSNDGLLVATLAKGELFLWETGTGKQVPLPFRFDVKSMAFSATKPLLATGSAKGEIDLWDVNSFSHVGSMQAHSVEVSVLLFSPKGQTLVSAGSDKQLNLWDCSGDHAPEKPILTRSWHELVTSMAFLPEARTLVIAGVDTKSVSFWEIGPRSLSEVRKRLHFAGAITRLDVSRNGRTLWTQGPGLLLPQQWDLNTLEVLQYCPLRTSEIGPNQRGIPSPEGDKLAFHEGDLSTINLWTTGTWKADQLANQHLGQVRSLVFSPTDDALFTGTATPTRLIRSESSILGKKVSADTRLLRDAAASLREWNPEDGSERPQLGGPEVMAPPDLVAMSSDGRTLVVGGRDGCVYLWDRDSRRYRQRLFVGPNAANYIPGIEIARQNPFGVNPQYPESVRAVAFCYCKDLLVTFSTRGMVTLWDSSQYRQIRQFTVDPQETRWVGFSPGGDLVLSQGGQLKFQDPISGELRCALGGESDEPIVCVAFSRDGALVAGADQKNRIHLWDRQTGAEKGQLLGHMDQVNALAFTPDSRTLASASNDRTVKLWSVATLAEMASLEAHAGNVTCLAFNSAGTILVTGGDGVMGQGEVFLWRAPADRIVPR